MAHYVLELSYKGTNYSGWQSQKNAPSVEAALRNALDRISLPATRVLSSSRTDAGVHAFQQIVRVDLQKEIACSLLAKSLNAVLPKDISIKNLSKCSPDFHPTHSAKKKIYTYTIVNAPGKSPFYEEFIWRVIPELDIEKMRLAAASFVGEHDFSSFCAADSGAKTKVRLIYDIQILAQGSRITINVLGRGFLKQMIRKMVGTLVEIGKGKRPPTDVKELLATTTIVKLKGKQSGFQKSGTLRSGLTAPAQGLCLRAVFYEQSPFQPGET